VLQPEDGGVAEHVLLLARGLTARGWRVEVASSPTNTIRPALRRAGIASHAIPIERRPGAADLRAARALRALDRRGRFDLVHAHSSKAGALARIALPRRRLRVLYTAHGFAFVGRIPCRERLLYRGIEQALVPATAALVAVSEFELANAARVLRGATRRFRLVRNGVPPCAEGRPDPELLRFKEDRPLAGLVSVLRPEKDPLTAVRAMSLLARRGAMPGRLAVVGNGWLENDVRAEIARLGVGEHVRWFPFRGAMASYLRALDLLVLPSLWESLPLGPIEAMTCSVPVLATPVGGVPEIVEEGVTGRLVDPGDPDALARNLEEMLGDASLLEQMGDAGRAEAAARFRLDRMVDETERVYEEVLWRT
jgi:glycosyltransferase involved in cell wall biosynthesis